MALVIATVILLPEVLTDLAYFDEGASSALVGMAFVAVGAVLGIRRSSNPIGWLFLGWGVVMISAAFGFAYITAGAAGAAWVAWLFEVIWHPAFALLVFILLLFPHGRLPSPRWRWFAYFVVAVYAALALATATSPVAWELYNPDLDPPIALPGGPVVDTVFETLLFGQLLLVVTSMVSLVLRFRRAEPVERQQLKWFVSGVLAAVILFVGGVITLGAGYLFPVFALIPITAGVAIMRYRLYDIDRIVSRTVTFAVVAGVLAVAYLGIVAVLTSVIPASGDLAVAGSTLVVAALFNPVRRRIQRFVERRFHRSHYDAEVVVDEFAASLRSGIDTERIVDGWVGVVEDTMQPAAVGYWLRHPAD